MSIMANQVKAAAPAFHGPPMPPAVARHYMPARGLPTGPSAVPTVTRPELCPTCQRPILRAVGQGGGGNQTGPACPVCRWQAARQQCRGCVPLDPQAGELLPLRRVYLAPDVGRSFGEGIVAAVVGMARRLARGDCGAFGLIGEHGEHVAGVAARNDAIEAELAAAESWAARSGRHPGQVRAFLIGQDASLRPVPTILDPGAPRPLLNALAVESGHGEILAAFPASAVRLWVVLDRDATPEPDRPGLAAIAYVGSEFSVLAPDAGLPVFAPAV